MTREEKLKERWLRRVVARQGYRLRKQRRWDVGAYDYGRYRIFGPTTSSRQVTRFSA